MLVIGSNKSTNADIEMFTSESRFFKSKNSINVFIGKPFNASFRLKDNWITAHKKSFVSLFR